MADEIDRIMNDSVIVGDLAEIAQELCDIVNMTIASYSPMERATIGRAEAKKAYHEMIATYHLTPENEEKVAVIFSGLMRRQAAVQIFGKTVDAKISRVLMKRIEKKLEKDLKRA